MKLSCLINPFSGGKQGRRLAESLRLLEKQHRYNLQILETSISTFKRDVATALTADIVLIAGGDGTVSAFLQCIGDVPVTIGILPIGTGNDLARFSGAVRKFNMARPQELIDLYLGSVAEQITVWKAEVDTPEGVFCRLFSNYLSYGIDGLVIKWVYDLRHNFPALFKVGGRLGNRIAYALASLAALPWGRIPNIRVLPSDPDFPPFKGADLRSLLFVNIRPVMGVGVSHPQSDPRDDRLEVIAAETVLTHLSMLLSHPLGFPKSIRSGSSTGYEIDSPAPQVCVQADGEPVPELAGKITRICPARKIGLLMV